MTQLRFTLSVLATLTLTLICASGAQAQAPSRVYVSAIEGSDTSQFCERTAPCREIRRALQVVAGGGVVVVLDSGDFQLFSVRPPVTIEAAPGVVATVMSITVDADPDLSTIATLAVVLRGLTVKGSSPSGIGIHYSSGTALHVENCVISGHGTGILYDNAFGQLFVRDTIVRDNFVDGIAITHDRFPESSLTPATVSIDHCRLERNGRSGLQTDGISRVTIGDSVVAGNFRFGLSAGGNSRVTIRDSVVASNGEDGFVVHGSVSVPTAELNIENCVVTYNGNNGIRAEGPLDHNPDPHAPGAFVSVSNSTITNNTNRGISASLGASIHVSNTTITRNNRGLLFEQGGTIFSFGDNKLFGNRTSDGAFTSTVPKR